MGHQIVGQLNAGVSHLNQCSCGRGALKVREKVLLLSSSDILEMQKLFSGLAKPALTEKLNRLTDVGSWTDFSIPHE
jgi:hypothetical protein